ncbi:MAG: biotin/lipoyl-containing protein [Niameybacter sp.]|uniref:biotin/lipoyl-containing protein n=1 Tax=Niameybacter sp. TaxID=2033640 RepID=UPI002FC70631
MRKFQVTVNGNTYEVEVEELVGGVSTPVTGVAQPIATPVVPIAPKAVATPVATGATGANKVVAPMPGKIVDVKVKVGQAVKEGDLIAILEAMKMENEVFASASGTIASVNVTAGAMVEANDVIVSMN